MVGVIAERSRQSLATIVDLNTRETRVVGVGDEVGGARCSGSSACGTTRDATGNGFRVVAIVCNGGTKEYLDFDPGAGSAEVAGNLGYAPVPPPRGPGPRARRWRASARSENKYEIERERHRQDARRT